METKPSRHWCLTAFSPDGHISDDAAASFITNSDLIRYASWQRERCPDTGRDHLQAYIELVRPARLSAARKLFSAWGIHLEPRRGTREQARDYTRKDDSRSGGPWEYGSFRTNQGKRKDIEDVLDTLDNHGLPGLLSDHPQWALLHLRHAKEYLSAKASMEALCKIRDVKTIWITGLSGVGKSYGVFKYCTEYHPHDYYVLSLRNWWDGYQGQRIVIIDELNEGEIKIQNLLMWLDNYEVTVPVKGSSFPAAWELVLITSNHKPDELYPNDVLRLGRRITHNLYVRDSSEARTYIDFALRAVDPLYKAQKEAEDQAEHDLIMQLFASEGALSGSDVDPEDPGN